MRINPRRVQKCRIFYLIIKRSGEVKFSNDIIEYMLSQLSQETLIKLLVKTFVSYTLFPIYRFTPGSEIFNEFMNTNLDNESICKIFIFDLSLEATENDVREAFSKFGEITYIYVVKKNPANKTRTYGFVTFRSPLSALKALCDNVTVAVVLDSVYNV